MSMAHSRKIMLWPMEGVTELSNDDMIRVLHLSQAE